MPKFAANLTMMFNEVPFLERFQAAKDAGFDAVEFLFPYDHPVPDVVSHVKEAGVTVALFNMPPGDWVAGERGIAALPDRKEEFQVGVTRAIEYARALECKTLHLMSGLVPENDDRDLMLSTYIERLRFAADACQDIGATVVIEPLNYRDVPGYLISDVLTAQSLVDECGRPNVGIQFDMYHVQIMEGDLAKRFEAHLDDIYHVQIAGVPERHEPNIGEVNYPYLFLMMDRLGYQGYVGCEYNPSAKTEDGLGWFSK
jgi:hydroxypyruvate isomerase